MPVFFPGQSTSSGSGSGSTVTLTLVDSSGGAQGVTSTAPASLSSNVQFIKKTSSDSNNVTITPPSGLIDGAATYVFSTPYQCVGITSDGTDTYVVS